MRIPAWRHWIGLFQASDRSSRARRRTRPAAARLALRRLEERRVLNGAPVAVAVTDDQGAVVVDAGPAADGAADVFQVIREGDQNHELLKISVNGAVVYESELDRVSSVSF